MRLLEFHRQALKEFQGQENHSGLMIMGRGLGLERILNAILTIHMQPHNLVLLLNVKEAEYSGLRRDLEQDSLSTNTDVSLEAIHLNLFTLIDNSTPAKDRTQIYLNGGVMCVTNQILVVDILNNVIPTRLITGIIVNHAEKVTENSAIAFILRLFRSLNKAGFIRAFSESPERFGGELTKLERMLKVLQVKNVYIYPRFQIQVSEEINNSGSVELVEIRVPYSKPMNDIQNGLMDCLSQILNELKRLYPQVY